MDDIVAFLKGKAFETGPRPLPSGFADMFNPENPERDSPPYDSD